MDQSKTIFEQIADRLSDYDAEGAKLWDECVAELFKNGFSRGCFPDYGVIVDIGEVLLQIGRYLKCKYKV